MQVSARGGGEAGVWALKNIQKHPSKPFGNLKNTKCDAYQLALWRIYINEKKKKQTINIAYTYIYIYAITNKQNILMYMYIFELFDNIFGI